MLDNPVLDVAIGLIFVYLLYSLLATTLKELVATIFSYRPRMLELAIERMLDGKQFSYYWWDKLWNFILWLSYSATSDKEKKKSLGSRKCFMQNIPVEKEPTHKRVKLDKKAKLFASHFFRHPIYQRAAEDSIFSKKPAYLPASSFSDILINLLSLENEKPVLLSDITNNIAKLHKNGNGRLCKETKQILIIYINQANGDMQRFKLLLEDWYNDTMDRVSGWYKRQAYAILFVIGLVLAASFNVDTIRIVSKLSSDKDVRAEMVKNASAYVANQTKNAPAASVKKGEKPADQIGDHIKDIKNIYNNNIAEQNKALGLGWDNECYMDTVKYDKLDTWVPFWLCFFWWSILPAIIGFLITALAISLGAPFWFDLLNKFVNLRVSGKKPDDTPAAGKTTTLNQKPLINSFG